ncbi:DUF3263 domain-containing protein [Nocardia sp. NPDC057663]|uniref:DUF3263 domain-containing protein n=1 Tax=Nocardia sp. NPDC057663 TaxID=3346201 RepID=UPI00366E60F8
MIKFGLDWRSGGDGDEFILAEFGITPTEFYRRLQEYAARPEYWGIEPWVGEQLRLLCARKITVSEQTVGDRKGSGAALDGGEPR